MTTFRCRTSEQIHVICFCLAPLALLWTGCDISLQGIRGSGVTQSETREISEFDRIEVDGIGTVNVEFGTKPALQVTGDDNLLEFVETQVVDGVLKISLRENINPVTKLTFDVVATKLKAAEIGGAARLYIRSAKLDDLHLIVDGAGEIVADGTAGSVKIEVSGAAKIDTNALLAKSVKISISGAANANIYASETLDATISGAAKVNCLGKPPKVTKNVSGAGRIKVDE